MNEIPAGVADQEPVDGGRFLTREDIHAIALSALDKPNQPNGLPGANDPSLIAALLSFGCQIWIAGGWTFLLPAPSAAFGSPAYAGALFAAMSDLLPKRGDLPGIKSVSEILEGLFNLCEDLANGASIDSVGRTAFLTGISVGRFGHVGVNDEQYKLASTTLKKALTAKARRGEALRQKRSDYEQRLLRFALKEVAADPRVSNAAIQRRWRKDQKLSETVTSNNEAKLLARFRSDRRLPLRKTGKSI